MRLGAGLLAVRAGEGRLVGLLAALFATIEAGRGLGDVAVTTLFLNRVGAASLPWLFIALGLVSLVVALGYGAAIGRVARRPFFVGLLVAFAAALVLLRLAAVADTVAVYGLLWVVVNVVNALLLTVVWTVAGTTLDVRQAKRLFPLCTSAAIAGSFVGTLASGPLAAVLGTENLIVLDAALLVVAVALVARIVGGDRPGRTGRAGTERGAGTAGSPTSLRAQLRRGFDDVRASPLLRLVAVAYVLFSVLLFSVTFPYQGALQRAFEGDEAGLATTVGLIQAAVTAVSFLVSLALANRVYARFGVAAAALILPVVYVLGFGTWLVQFTFATAVGFVVVQQVVQRSLSNAAWSAMFTVVPSERRPQVLAFIDGVPGQLGTSLSGVLLLVATAAFSATQAPIFAMGLVAALVLTWIVARIRRRYGEALVRTLRAGLAEQVLEGGAGLQALARAPGVTSELETALRDPAAGTRRLAADLLGRLGSREATAALEERLGDEDAEVRAAALRALAALEPERARTAADRLAGDPSAAVRAERGAALIAAGDEAGGHADLNELLALKDAAGRLAALDVAGRLGDVALEPPLVGALADPDARIRAAAARALAGLPSLTIAADPLRAALDDDAGTVRRAAALTLARHGTATPALLEVLRHGPERAQEAAVIALAGGDGSSREPVRSWALERVARAAGLRRHAAALGGAPSGPAIDFLRAVVERRGRRLEDQVLTAVAALGAPQASGLLRRCLRSPNADTRAQAIEAIDAIGDRRLAQAIVGLLDSDGARDGSTAAGTVQGLMDDPDPWLRTIAIRAGAEALDRQQAELARRATSDPDPAVRTRLGSLHHNGGLPMADTDSTLGELDRMLFLRRVPLFSQLDPEDLQRLAATATERLYAAEEALVREGEDGDELIVLVEGRVRVIRTEADTERLLRTYEAGDHIGELAVLRDRPRAATVIAETAVRGLVIGGEGLRAILTERPEAAMAMLGTLAERISAQ